MGGRYWSHGGRDACHATELSLAPSSPAPHPRCTLSFPVVTELRATSPSTSISSLRIIILPLFFPLSLLSPFFLG